MSEEKLKARFIVATLTVSTVGVFLLGVRFIPAPAVWTQRNDPTGHWWLSAVLAAMPLMVLLSAMSLGKLPAHLAALSGLVTALAVAVLVHHMPVGLALRAAGFGSAYGLFPVCWIIFPVIFLYRLTLASGHFSDLKNSLTAVTQDSRLQVLLIAFALGAFLEGASGFGTPVAVCGALLVSLGFDPVQAAILALFADTAPVAFGSLGIPVTTLSAVSGLNLRQLAHMVAILLVPLCVVIPFWLVVLHAGVRAAREVWKPTLLAGGVFSAVQYILARELGPGLVDLLASLATIAALILLLRRWSPATIYDARMNIVPATAHQAAAPNRALRGWTPWLTLSVILTLWSVPSLAHMLDAHTTLRLAVPGLNDRVYRTPPIVMRSAAEPAVFVFNWLTATGTASFLAAMLAAVLMRVPPKLVIACLRETARSVRLTVLTIASMLALGFVSRYAGLDATVGLAFAHTGLLYPFFGTLIGWLGTLSTGSDTSSNVLFGSLQTVTARQTGVSPVLMCSANTTGGVMAKMIAAPSVVVATVATGASGQEGRILRFLFLRSLILASVIGVMVLMLAHLLPHAR